MKRFSHIALPLILSALATTPLSAQIKGDDQTKSFQERADALVAKMTLEEKASQMVNSAKALPKLGLPAYNWWNECLHGLARAGKSTVFPQAMGLAATFNPELIHDMADAISDEARVFNREAIKRGNVGLLYTGLTFYSPNVNIYRDPRWGRGQETYGEDPYLTSRMGVEFVKGLQGDDPKYLKTAACAKHYAVHSGPEKLRHVFDAKASDRDLYETYLPAFKALVKEAKVKSVMGAYNRTNGEACCASPELLVNILRKDWGFDGYLTTDCGAIVDIYKNHKMVKTPEEATAMAINTTMNLNCGSVYDKALVKAVNQGLIKESQVDDLLSQLLVTRFELGMFDDQEKVPFSNIDIDIANSQKHKDIAYQTALQSLVLLENKNNVLPLKDNLKYIYVTGPNANNADALIGNYFGVSDRFVTYLEGIVSKAPTGVSIQYKQGVMLDGENKNPIDWATGEAAKSDAVVACMGITWLIEGEEGEAIASSQGGDMYNNSISAAQIAFLKKLKSRLKNKQPLIVVMSGGCPVQLDEIREIADALIYAWYPGEAGGTALADIILGNANPSGRTPITFVKSLSDLPPFEDYNMEGRTYRYMRDKEPLYPFGYGLSYSTFEYSDLKMASKVKAGEPLKVNVTVKNSSKIAGDEVVQLYITDKNASVPVPVRQLAAFTRVSLKSGESKQVTLEVMPDKMSVITNDVKRKIESGDFTISVGGGQPVPQTPSYQTADFKVTGNKVIEL